MQQAESDLTSGESALYWVLKGRGVLDPKATAQAAHRILAEHPGWPYNPGLQRLILCAFHTVSRWGGPGLSWRRRG